MSWQPHFEEWGSKNGTLGNKVLDCNPVFFMAVFVSSSPWETEPLCSVWDITILGINGFMQDCHFKAFLFDKGYKSGTFSTRMAIVSLCGLEYEEGIVWKERFI